MKARRFLQVQAALLLTAALVFSGCPRPPQVTVTVTPNVDTIEVGETVALSATSTDSADGFDWASSNTSVATVDSSGVVTGVGVGTATIRATGTESGAVGGATITVTEPADEVTVTPAAATVEVGGTTTLAASSTNSADSFAWSSLNTGVATVDASGVVTGVAPGTATIQATGSDSGAVGEASITVTEPTAVVTVTPGSPTIEVGATTTLSASSTEATDSFTWASLNESVATVDAAGVVTGVAAGTATIQATGSVSGAVGDAIVTVEEPPATITVTPSETTLAIGERQQFTASSTDGADGFTWSTSNNSVAEVDSAGLVTAVAEGSATITATGTNSGAEGTAAVTVSSDLSAAVSEDLLDAQRFVVDLPSELVDEDTRKQLLDLLEEAEGEYRNGLFCDAGETLNLYLAETLDLRAALVAMKATEQDVSLAEWLYAQGRGTQYDLLVQQPGGNECPGFERIGMGAEVKAVENSNAQGLDATFGFGAPRTIPYTDPSGVSLTELLLPALQEQSGDAGEPQIPALRKLVAVPRGAEVSVEHQVVIAEQFAANLMPVQEQPVDQEQQDPTLEELPPPEFFGNKPFVRDEALYDTNEPWPPSPVRVTRLGEARGMDLIQLEIFSGQHNPAADEVVLFEEVEVNINFGKGDGFVPPSALNPFDSSSDVFTSVVLNREALFEIPPYQWELPPILTGEEFMIITHPDFRAAADALAVWKNAKGIVTHVYEAGTGSGIAGRQTADEIDDFIENHADTVITKPSYILLLGDAEYIPPFLGAAMGGGAIGTDWFYAERSYPGQEFPSLVPTFAVGRIPVDTQEQAQVVVDKIIDYEKTPPGTIVSDAFYRDIMIAAQFQCCRTTVPQAGTAQRTFTEVSEYVRNELVNRGYNVERVYERTVDGAYAGDPTPRRYYDGTPLPPAIGPGSGFAWNGDTADVRDGWNAGRFLIMHRDHGWSGGWGTPYFDNSEASALTNGDLLPVVYSINCTSGYFDNETAPGGSTNSVYFCERLLRNPNGGAVGVIGDTRVSPSWPNSALTRGLFDATWPNTVPSFGANVSKRRLGDILNHAKLYLLTQIGVAGQKTSYASAYNELLLYHVLGDPTLEMWTKDPRNLLLPGNFILYEFNPLEELIINYPREGVILTAYQEVKGQNIPVGRAPVRNGQATMDLVNEPLRGIPVQVVANEENAVSVAGEISLLVDEQ